MIRPRALLLAAAALVGLSGCGGDPQVTAPVPQQSTSAPSPGVPALAYTAGPGPLQMFGTSAGGSVGFEGHPVGTLIDIRLCTNAAPVVISSLTAARVRGGRMTVSDFDVTSGGVLADQSRPLADVTDLRSFHRRVTDPCQGTVGAQVLAIELTRRSGRWSEVTRLDLTYRSGGHRYRTAVPVGIMLCARWDAPYCQPV